MNRNKKKENLIFFLIGALIGLFIYFGVQTAIEWIRLSGPNRNVLYEKYSDYFVEEESKGKESKDTEIKVLILEGSFSFDSIPEGQLEKGVAFTADTEKQEGTPVVGGAISVNPYAGKKEEFKVMWVDRDVRFKVAVGKMSDSKSDLIMKVNVPADGKFYKLEIVKNIACRRWKIDYYKDGKYRHSRFYDRFEIEGIDANLYPADEKK